jgi:hypothetical protein
VFYRVEPTAMYQRRGIASRTTLLRSSWIMYSVHVSPHSPMRYGAWASVLLVWLNAEIGVFTNFYILGSLLVLTTYGTKYSTRGGERSESVSLLPLCTRTDT